MRIARVGALTDEQRSDVRALAARVTAADGAEPLNDQTLLGLARDDVVHLLGRDGARLVGYAQVDGDTAEIAVDPDTDRAAAATATALIDAATAAGAELLWAHGDRSPVGAVLAGRGTTRDRVLLQLLRRAAPVEAVDVPAGVRLRAFVPGGDEDAWLAVNARAFAGHREQGRWTRADLEARERADWFDPRGFLLAVDARTGDLLGFHWTKIHAGSTPPLGEVYVIAVDPSAQGRGLSRVLLAAGLRSLAERGAGDTELYTDDTNDTARHVYERAGFGLARTDVQYRL